MYDEEENSLMKFKLRNLRSKQSKISSNKSKADFPVDMFETTLNNLLKMYQVNGTIELFKQNLIKMNELSKQFQDTICTIFKKRNLFPFLIELLKTSDIEIQSNSLSILSNLLLFHEDVVKFFVDNSVYPNIMNFFRSGITPLVNATSIFFINSIISSPVNFLNLFINNFLENLLQIFEELDKNDSSPDIIFMTSMIFYQLFKIDYKVDSNILEKVYQNILLTIYERNIFILFLNFVYIILDSDDDQFVHIFLQTDFPIYVMQIINKFNNGKANFQELNICLIVIHELFNNKYMIIDLQKYEKVLVNISKLIYVDKIYDIYGRKINENDDNVSNDDNDENDTLIDPSIFKEISVNSIHIFIVLVYKLHYDGITFLSNHHIISNFIDYSENYSFSQKEAYVELCLVILEYSSDDQFRGFIEFTQILTVTLENIDISNNDHITALDKMICKTFERPNSSYSIFMPYYPVLVQIQDEIEKENESAIYKASNLTMLIRQLENYNEDVQQNNEGQISDYDDDINEDVQQNNEGQIPDYDDDI